MSILKPYIADPEVSLGNAYGDLGNVDHQKELLEKALNIQDRWILDTIGWNIWFSCSLFIYSWCWRNRVRAEICRHTKVPMFKVAYFFFWPSNHKIEAKAGNQDTSKEVQMFLFAVFFFTFKAYIIV